MNVLLIEDNDSKASKVISSLQDVIESLNLVRARSFRSGVKQLEATSYDLLILDMILPVRDGEAAEDNCGAKILTEIQDGSFCRRPAHIICLTAFDNVAEAFKNEASKRLVHVVVYSETNTEWSEALCGKAKQIEKRIIEANIYPESYQCDLAIVTSAPPVELQEVIKLPGFQGEFHQKDSLHYYRTAWKSSSGKVIDVIACSAPLMGMTAAAITASKVIKRWRPRYLAMTGIAAGTKKLENPTESQGGQNFGDILVAESSYDYGSGKISDAANGERRFTPNFNQVSIDSKLHALVLRWAREQLHADSIRKNWFSPQQTCPRIIVGILATGAAVVQSKELVQEILDKSRKVVGLDMEAYGVMHAAKLASSPQPKILIAKSISDFADSDKNDFWQQYAAYTSSRFIYEFFTNEADLEFCQ